MRWGKKKEIAEPVVEEKGPDFSLFDKAVETENNEGAVIVGSNLLNQDPKNGEFFFHFFDWLCGLSLKSEDLLVKEGYYGLANDACSSFTLSMDLNPENIALVTKCRDKLKEVQQNRYEAQVAAETERVNEIIKANRKRLENIRLLLVPVGACKSLEELEELSKGIVKIDRNIDREYMSEFQDEYDDLMKELSEKIAEKTKILRRKTNLKINQTAVETYKTILEAFHKSEDYYSKKDADIGQFYSVLDYAFKYRESDLFPETIAYYSYVYNYIFTTVGENQKYELTKHMIVAKGDAKE